MILSGLSQMDKLGRDWGHKSFQFNISNTNLKLSPVRRLRPWVLAVDIYHDNNNDVHHHYNYIPLATD